MFSVSFALQKNLPRTRRNPALALKVVDF